MNVLRFLIWIILLSFSFALFAENEADSIAAYSIIWKTAGSNAIIDSVFTIDVTAIPDSMTYEFEGDYIPISDAQIGNGFDNSLTFNRLITWLNGRAWLQNIHAQIYIPEGDYNFSDQLVMYSNISLKGAGSDATTLRFLIESDSIMTETDCKKDAILLDGSGFLQHQLIRNVGIENLKIIREKGDDFTNDEIYSNVGDCCYNGTPYTCYWGNNIAIRRSTNCWVRGVKSSNTFRNHVTLESSKHISISGVYFYNANKYCNGGFGYGVGLWDSSRNLVENSIFRHLRHAITVIDSSWYNVIAYNYIREQHSTEFVPGDLANIFGYEIDTRWSDITLHGESANVSAIENNHPDDVNENRRPFYNLIEGQLKIRLD